MIINLRQSILKKEESRMNLLERKKKPQEQSEELPIYDKEKERQHDQLKKEALSKTTLKRNLTHEVLEAYRDNDAEKLNQLLTELTKDNMRKELEVSKLELRVSQLEGFIKILENK